MADPEAPAGPQGPGSQAEPRGKARHGAPSEVSWDEGRVRQPYENQDPSVPEDPAAAGVPEGDRGAASGRNLEDLERSREKWDDTP